MSQKKYGIGIDLGTTQCNVGVVCKGITKFLNSDHDGKYASVTFTETEVIVGLDGVNDTIHLPSNTIYGIKKILCKDFDDPIVRRLQRYVPYTISKHDNKTCVKVMYKGTERHFTPQEIITFILEYLKKSIETLIKDDVTEVVIAVPGSFTEVQRQVVKDAATAAGLIVTSMIAETTATAVSFHGSRRRRKRDSQNVAVVDMGGGKLDVSLITLDDDEIEVRAVSGSTEVGGDSLVEMLMDRVCQKWQDEFSKPAPKDPTALRKLRKICRNAMRNLSVVKDLLIIVDCFGDEDRFEMNILDEDYNEWAKEIIRPTMLAALDKVFTSSGLRKQAIDTVLLVGGCTCKEEFRTWLKEYFGHAEINGRNVNPLTSVAEGAAMHAAFLAGDRRVRQLIVRDILPNVGSITPPPQGKELEGESSPQR